MVGFAVDRSGILGLYFAGVLNRITAVFEALGVASQSLLRLLKTFRFATAGLFDRTLSFALFLFSVMSFGHAPEVIAGQQHGGGGIRTLETP